MMKRGITIKIAVSVAVLVLLVLFFNAVISQELYLGLITGLFLLLWMFPSSGKKNG